MNVDAASSSSGESLPSPPSRLRLRPSRAWRKRPREPSAPQPQQPPEEEEPTPTRPPALPTSRPAGISLQGLLSRRDDGSEAVRAAAARTGDGAERPPADGEASSFTAAGADKLARTVLHISPSGDTPNAKRAGRELATASTSKQEGPPARPPTVHRYKTPSRRFGPPPDGKWAASTFRQLAAEATEGGEPSENENDDLAELPSSVQQAFATWLPRTASKMLKQSAHRSEQAHDAEEKGSTSEEGNLRPLLCEERSLTSSMQLQALPKRGHRRPMSLQAPSRSIACR